MSEMYIRLDPSLIPILRPVCPTCQGRMMLTCIEPGYNNGPDLRIFECSKCGHVYKAPAEDPMTSAEPSSL
jgi:ribosomal protein L37AE/L43A